jgi:hypothetical protein
LPFAYIRTVVLFTVTGFTAALKVIVTGLFTATPVAPLPGLKATTVGPLVSGAAELDVVNPLVNACTAFPARSVNPLTATVYGVVTASVKQVERLVLACKG